MIDFHAILSFTDGNLVSRMVTILSWYVDTYIHLSTKQGKL